jgi:hypothetical protein
MALCASVCMTLAIQTSVNNRKSARQVDRSKVRPTIAATSSYACLVEMAAGVWRSPSRGLLNLARTGAHPYQSQRSGQTLQSFDPVQMTSPVGASAGRLRLSVWLSSALSKKSGEQTCSRWTSRTFNLCIFHRETCSSYLTVRCHLHRAAERWQMARRGPQARGGECDDNVIGSDEIVNQCASMIDSPIVRASR